MNKMSEKNKADRLRDCDLFTRQFGHACLLVSLHNRDIIRSAVCRQDKLIGGVDSKIPGRFAAAAHYFLRFYFSCLLVYRKTRDRIRTSAVRCIQRFSIVRNFYGGAADVTGIAYRVRRNALNILQRSISTNTVNTNFS